MPGTPPPHLPSDAVLLHIGPYKTGSTTIQAAMNQARAEMLAQGVRYAGRGTRAMRAGWAVIGQTPRGRPTARIEEWEELAEQVRSEPDLRVCLSTEDFGRVGPDVAQRVVDDLGPERVHVLTVVRRLDRLLPSQWQQRAQSFKTDAYDEYLHVVLDEDGPRKHQSRRAFWASHDVEKVLRTWSSVTSPDRVVAIVADESDRTLLPRTFESLLGLSDGLLQDAPSANPSLSFNGVEVLRRLNVLAEERHWPDPLYARLSKSMVEAMKRAERSPHDMPVPRLPAWAADRVAELSAARADAVAASGVRVVGDVDSLRTVAAAEAGAEDVASISLDSVVHGLAGCVEGHRRLEGRVRRERRRVARVERRIDARARGTVDEATGKELLGVVGRRATSRLKRG